MLVTTSGNWIGLLILGLLGIKLGRHTMVGLALDIIDWIGIGLLPILADVVDIIGTVYFYKVLGPLGLVSAVELIPLADVLPTNLLLGLYADRRRGETNA